MKYWIIALISFVISNSIALAANDSFVAITLKSDSIYKMHLLKAEYVFFTAKNEEEKYDALMQKVLLAIENEQTGKAIDEINRIELFNEELLLKKDFYAEIEKVLFKAGLYNACLEIMKEDTLHKFSNGVSFMKVLCLNQEGEYDAIIEELKFASIQLEKDTTAIFKVLQPYEFKSKTKKSTLYQALLPGAGMIKEGELKEGITSFLLNGIFITSPILLLNRQLYFNAISYGFLPFTKFYLGGIRHTQYLSEKNEAEKLKELKQKNAALLFQFYHN